MLIINADDLGRNKNATDNIVSCFQNGRITSASAMVFMRDSARASGLIEHRGQNIGLHLNFVEPFDGAAQPAKLIDCQHRIVSFLTKNKYYLLLYHPFLAGCFEYIFFCQYEEFLRLYEKPPAHINGHRHMHLCTNMLLNNKIAKGSNVRRSFTFIAREKSLINRLYRYVVDRYLKRRYRITDYFFSIEPFDSDERLQNIINLARRSSVELMVHPEWLPQYDFLMSDKFWRFISGIEIGTFTVERTLSIPLKSNPEIGYLP